MEIPGNDLRGASFQGGYAEKVYGNQIGTQNNYPQSQNLAEAATEIQNLLDRLSLSHPTTTEVEKQKVVHEAIKCIQSDPTLKTRVWSALKAGSIEALKAIANHPAVSIPVETIKGWIEAE